MSTAAERKAVIKLMQSPNWDDWSEEEAAEQIITALDSVREAAKKYVVVAQLELGGIYHVFASGPYNTITQAKNAGPGFAWSGRTGKGRWKIAPILATPRKAWDFLIEQEAAHGPKPWGWIKNEEGRWMWNKKEFASENPDIERELNEWSWRATKDLDKGGW